MAIEFKDGSRDRGIQVDLGIAHGKLHIPGQEYSPEVAESLLAGFAAKNGYGDLKTVSPEDREFLVQYLNLERQDMPGLPKLTES